MPDRRRPAMLELLQILLVDDSTPNASRFRELLPDGWALTTACDLAEAGRVLAREVPDAVVVDGAALAADDLPQLRALGRRRALLVLRHGRDGAPPIEPADVGEQRSLDLEGVDARALALTVQLAVERHRAAELRAAAVLVGGAAGHPGASTWAGADGHGTHGVVGDVLRADARAARRAPGEVVEVGSCEALLRQVGDLIDEAIRFHRPLTVVVGLEPAVADGAVEGDRAAEDEAAEPRRAAIARVVADHLRASDLVGRLPDGQLVIAMVATTAEAASPVVDRLRAAVREAVPDCGLRVGVAQLEGLMAVDELVHAAVRRATADAGPPGDRRHGEPVS